MELAIAPQGAIGIALPVVELTSNANGWQSEEGASLNRPNS